MWFPGLLLSENSLYIFSYACSYLTVFNLVALRIAKVQWSLGHSECNRVESVLSLVTMTTVSVNAAVSVLFCI